MTFSYEQLTPQDRVRLVEERLRQLEADHYTHVLARQAGEQASDVAPEQRVEMLDRLAAQIDTLEAAIRVHRRERDDLLESAPSGPAED
jgi:hypothetical protein